MPDVEAEEPGRTVDVGALGRVELSRNDLDRAEAARAERKANRGPVDERLLGDGREPGGPGLREVPRMKQEEGSAIDAERGALPLAHFACWAAWSAACCCCSIWPIALLRSIANCFTSRFGLVASLLRRAVIFACMSFDWKRASK